MVSLYVESRSRRILTAVSERYQLRIFRWVGYALCVEELGREELGGLCETGSEIPYRRESSHPEAPPEVSVPQAGQAYGTWVSAEFRRRP